ncbi:lytic transglycosylase [Shewanella vesiculosa]|uniref:transglycosylase SLT domain-containing protein n=1 Tax=Shewanella vesiculosa TaxID=518738 RepID=UPI000F4EFB4A|nr:transglycosylase SLT domain-containing protein [Shewanella vesiculosa]RPA51317.1 lytic transglycosylase [Shewanella vesiculosa]UJL43181.1 transglycosylase SLT domain-containing protein [Shewanella vesiculosa]
MRNTWANMLMASALLFSTSLAFISQANALTSQQQRYLDARQALDKNQLDKYQVLRKKLADYPLTVYLDYHATIDSIVQSPGSIALNAINKFDTTPLYNNARYRYLLNAGKKQRWQDFLVISPDTPNDIRLQCYYYQAQLDAGNKEMAYKGVERIWVYGYSRPKECDAVINQWTKAGYRTQELIWARMLLSFDAGQSSLLNYLSQKITQHDDEAKLLLSVYRDPNSLRHMKKFASSKPIIGDIVDAGLRKLAYKDLHQAIKLYVKYQKLDRFSDFGGRQLNRYLVRRALIKQDDKLVSHIDTMLPLLKSDDLYEMRLRWAIRQQDFATVEKYLALLSDQGKADPRWQYWQAKMTSSHDKNRATQLQLTLSGERNFYGFNAAEALGKPLAMNDNNLAPNPELQAKLNQDPGLARVIELMALDKQIDARNEWLYLMRRHNSDMTAQYGLLALKNGWHALSVESSIQGKLWDSLALRFPEAANDEFVNASKKFSVNIDEIRAISRRESAFYLYATSGVGARGLMQLMPATAKQTAKRNKIPFNNVKDLYDPKVNIMLGSAYYSELLKQFDQNRVLATAAYNAGPGSVKRWLKDSNGRLDVMSFIETIPYTETREYVQAVLSYRMIFQQNKSSKDGMFSRKELSYRY